MTRNKILLALGLIVISGITFVCWQYRQDKEFSKNLECQKLGQYYNPKINECVEGSYCLAHSDDYWCK